MPSHVYDVAFSRSGAKCSVAAVDSKVYVVDLRMCCVCWEIVMVLVCGRCRD